MNGETGFHAPSGDIFREIAGHTRAEVALRLLHEHFRRFVDSNIIGFMVAETAGAVIEANDYCLRLLGRTRKELAQGKVNWRAMTPPEWLPASERAIRELRERGACAPSEREFLQPDGTRVSVYLASALLPGSREQFAVFAIDLTDRNHAEERNREQATLLDTAADAIYVTALDCTITYWNQGAERVYGWKRDEALNRKTTELISLDGTGAELSEIVLKEEHWSGERRQIKRDGKAVDVFSRLMLVRDKRGQPKSIFAINTDITEKKLLEGKFLHTQQLESIGMLAAGIAHDLNNVLTPIMAIASLLRPRLSSESDLKILDTLEQSAQRGAGLVGEILSFVRSNTGEFRPTQVKHIANDIINLVEETFRKSIRLETEIGSDLWLVLGNATQIHQVLLNLCINARDAMPKGGTLRIIAANRRLNAAEAAAIPAARPGAWLMLEVADTGTGIEPEVLKSIWMPFFTTKGVGKGTGLGLSTIRGIVANHGGFVDLQTEVGRGSTFRVFLPAVEDAESPPTSVSPSGIPHGRGKLILVVDDEASIRAITTAVLRKHNYGVLSCGDGMEAIALFKAHRDEIALVITDVDMPNLNGAVLAKTLLQIRPDIRLIAMSGLPRSDTASSDVSMARELAHTFLAKPFRPEDLLGAVHSLLHSIPAPGTGID